MKKQKTLFTAAILLTLSLQAEAFLGSTNNDPDRIHAPPLPAGVSVPLVVVLHGCGTNAASIEERTQWNDLADEKKFVVLYPNLRNSRNNLNCWSWYDADSQTRDGEETGVILKAIDDLMNTYPIDRKKVFITGVSAGAATVANLASCFPERFAAMAMHSGMSYGLATDGNSAYKIAKRGPDGYERSPDSACNPVNFKGGVMVVHGKKDNVMNPLNSNRVVQDFILDRDSGTTQETTNYKPTKKFFASGKYPYSVTDYKNAGHLTARFVLVEKLKHAWSGGKEGSLSDPNGPPATRMMWDFFQGF